VIGVCAVLPWATLSALPRYAAGVRAAQWALLDIVVVALLTPRLVFSSIGKPVLYFWTIIAGMVAHLAALGLLGKGGLRLEVFPQAMLVGRVVHVICCYLVIYLACRGERPGSAVCQAGVGVL